MDLYCSNKYTHQHQPVLYSIKQETLQEYLMSYELVLNKDILRFK